MFCRNCGSEIPEGLQGCSRCTRESPSALMPAFRIRTEQIPALLGSQLKTSQQVGLAFGARDMVVKSAVVQSFNLGSSSSGKVMFSGLAGAFGRWSVFGGLGSINQQTTNSYRTDIQIKLADDTGLKAFLNYSLPFAITLAIEPGEALRIFFVKGGLPRPTSEEDFRVDAWTPFAAESLDTRQLIPITGVPTLEPPDKTLLAFAVISGLFTLISLSGGTFGVIFFLFLISAGLITACVLRERSYRFGLQVAVHKASKATV